MHDFVADIARLWFANVAVDLRRYAIFAVTVWLVLWVGLAGALRARKIREASPPARQLVTEFLVSIRSIAVFSSVNIIMVLLERAGLYPLPKIAAGWGPAWFWASLVLMIVGHDAYFYWTHRLMHDPRLFRRVHRRHHRSNNPSPFTAYSFDLAEAGLMVLFILGWFLVVPTPWAVGTLFMLHQIARNTLLHSGYELMPARRDGRPWLDFLTTTTHHDLHHAQAGWNYGAWFTWWDRWLGTEHPDYRARFSRVAWRPFGARNRALEPLAS
jgi:sterol desaturase/sphingolipid hydroxylase (fatty acid hydroxylase superfamily)